MRRRTVSAAALAATVGAASAMAQTHAGGEFRVNAYTTGQQTFPAVAAAPKGDFVVLWQDYERHFLFGQRFDRAGTPLAADFQLNTVCCVLSPAVAVRPTDDGFLVVWPRIITAINTDIDAQLFDASGRPVGSEFQVSEGYLVGRQFAHAVAADGRGGFVIAWMRFDGSGYGITARQLDPSGEPLGPEFRVNSYTTGAQIGTSVAADAAGNFVVVWHEGPGGNPSYGNGIVAQRFDAGGNRLGTTFLVNSATTGGHFDAHVAMSPDGAFVAAFVGAESNRRDVFARRFTPSGEAIGTDLQVNTYAINAYTTGDFVNPAVAMDAQGNFVVSWRSNATDGDGLGVAARRIGAGGVPRGAELVVNTYTTGTQQPGYGAVGVDEVGNFVIVWRGPGSSAFDNDIFAQRFGGLHPSALELDAAGNQVWEPGETALVRPSWFNANGAAQTVGGALSNLTGPAGPTYSIPDGTAVYPTLANDASAACTDCYSVTVTGARPVLHWDASARETLTPDAHGEVKAWTLHLGGTFADVPSSGLFYRFVETLLHNGITGGCGGSNYCPGTSTTRDQMAVFVLVAKEGAAYAPPVCGTPVFDDVPASSPFCRWIEELARRGVTGGCGGGNYCPSDPVSREQMAVFVLRTLDPALDPPACTTPVFSDVPASSPFCRWIEELARRGVVSGCGGGNYCPTVPVTREQMAVFLTGTFGLTLYGP